MSTTQFLWRSPNPQEINIGFRLIPTKPREGKSFKDDKPKFVMAHGSSGTYTHVGTVPDAILQHQTHGDTEGVSTTKSFDVAKRYALKRPSGYQYVVRIPYDRLKEYRIYDASLLGLRAHKPLDDEVILVSHREGPWCPEIIDKVYRVMNEAGDLEEVIP